MSALQFDAVNHRYMLDGAVLPSVTQVLQVLGGYEDVSRGAMDLAAKRGSAVHYATELADQSKLDWGSLDDELVGYVSAWELFKREKQPVFLATERALAHRQMRFAGTPDRIAIMGNKRGVLDIKTTAKDMPMVGPQTAAYLTLWNAEAEKDARLTERWGVRLQADGRYFLKRYSHSADWNTFACCLNITNWKLSHHDRQH